MPQRKHKAIEKVNCEAIMGEDSWVEIRNPTYEDLELVMDGAGEMDEGKKMEISKMLINRLVLNWNWVDDDGAPMPKPTPEILSKLPLQETLFLVDAISLDEVTDNQKKSKKQ
jgi:hypothetical protein